MIIDSATIHVRSGKGGDGAATFRREKYIPKGGPDGGDGGDGGSVVLVASNEVDTLLDFAGRHHWHAAPGENGMGKGCYGKSAEDLHVRLPPGTLVYDADTGELIVDLDQPGKTHVVAQGGKGGRGNIHFATSTNQAPRTAEPGGPAEERALRLELKLIADVGLIGKPNAGKSTLLSVISKATPKIADYPFTTLEPNLGIADLPGRRAGAHTGRRIVFADIPGLIEHAHEGAGLGVRFLRHVERTKLLVHLIEIDPTDGHDPVENYRIIRRELAGYSPELAAKPELIALSKIELVGGPDDQAAAVQMIERELGQPVRPISAATGVGLPELLEACWERLGKDEAEQAVWTA